jgi:D-alanyl-D-alanine dipeptidase
MISSAVAASTLPGEFVYLRTVDPSIQQDIRYAGYHNFIGRPIKGYEAAECILTKPAAEALHQIQMELKETSLSLKVYDCYRPQMAVADFIAWSKLPDQQQMKAEFYPRVNKADFFKLGYVAAKSGHTRGSTMDLTIVPIPTTKQENYQSGQKLTACFADYGQRFQDNSIDMGTGFDCMDILAHNDNENIDPVAYQNRLLLRYLMEKHGFSAYEPEWWHFTLKNEPYPKTYFNFAVRK